MRFILAFVTLLCLLPLSGHAQRLELNEIKPVKDTSSNSVDNYKWIELKNFSVDTVSLSAYTLSLDSVVFVDLPDRLIAPGQYFTLWFGEAEEAHEKGMVIPFSFPDSTKVIYLIDKDVISKAAIPRGITKDESYGKYPEGSDDWIFFLQHRITQGAYNAYPGPWQKLATETSFSPRDSSPNGALVYDGKVWVLEGYKYLGEGVYGSTSDVHNSIDGIHWELVNPAPPYNPYSAFIVFDGWMWAFENRAYRSKDGETWEDAGPIPLSNGGRVALLDGTLYWTSGRDIYRSTDGIYWELLLYDGPWGIRAWPGFQSMNGKLWLFGGAGDWNTSSPYYYNDVWSSTDGINWEREIENAAFPGRYWFSSHVYDNKIWILGGYNYYNELAGDAYKGNLNDIWYSENGVDWHQLETDTWPQRHAALSWVDGQNLYISSGADGYFLLNDVWRFEKESLQKEKFISAGLDTLYNYGDPPGSILDAMMTGSEVTFNINDPSIAFIAERLIEPKNSGNTTLKISVTPDLLHYGGQIQFSLTVQKKVLEVKVADTVKPFGGILPEFEVEFNGFVNGDGPSALDILPSIYTDTHKFSPVGEYPVFLSGGASRNYSLSYKTGTLKIEGKDEMIVFPNPADNFLNIISSKEENTIKRIELYNGYGQLAYKLDVDNFQCSVMLESVPAGVYTLFVRGSGTLPFTMKRIIFVKR
jgi:hypothetical protein